MEYIAEIIRTVLKAEARNRAGEELELHGEERFFGSDYK